MSHVPLIFIIAGEPSGDALGADFMASLQEHITARFVGIGGPAMIAQGLEPLFPMEELSHIGITSILRHLPNLLGRLRYTVKEIQKRHPDMVVTIDAQEFSFRVLKRIHKLPKRPYLIHYVAPTVWAYWPGRARKIAKIVDALWCLYPFEPPYFRRYGLKATFVGHPIGNEKLEPLRRDPNLLCLLPGSRRSEIAALLPIFGEAAHLLRKEIPSLQVVIPTLPSLKSMIKEETKTWPFAVEIVSHDELRQYNFQKASVALAASGTVALQLAAAGLPFVIAYKVGKINEWLGKIFIHTPWICMVNILLIFQKQGPKFVLTRNAKKDIKEPWIPEYIQEDCTPENLKNALLKLLQTPEARQRQEQAMHEAIELLHPPSPDPRVMTVIRSQESGVRSQESGPIGKLVL